MLRRDLMDFADWCAMKLITPINVNTLVLEDYRKTWKGAPGTPSDTASALPQVLRQASVDRAELRYRYVEDQGAQDANIATCPRRI